MAANEPNLAQDLVRIHKVITRGLKVSMAKGREYLEAGFPDASIFQGYRDYTHSLAAVLGSHHMSEDSIAFPALRDKLPAAPFDRLSADHHVIESLLEQVNKAVAGLTNQSHDSALKNLVDRINEIFAIWEPHIQKEEFHFSKENLDRTIGSEEQGRLSASMGKDGQERAQPPTLVVPFLLYNLEPADRAAMTAILPPMVVNELLPKVWKDQWAPMKPFLLE